MPGLLNIVRGINDLWCNNVQRKELGVTLGLPYAISSDSEIPPSLTPKMISMINEWLGQESHERKWGSRERENYQTHPRGVWREVADLQCQAAGDSAL